MQTRRRRTPQENKLKPILERAKKRMSNVINTDNLKKDFIDPDLRSYGKNMPAVNKQVMKAGIATQKAKSAVQTVTKSPVVRKGVTGAKVIGEATKTGAVKVLKTYLKNTQKLADKIKPFADKLPKVPQTHRRRTK